MSRRTNYPYCMTLRLSRNLETELENLAYECRMSKAGFIRRILSRAIAEAHRRKSSPDLYGVGGGER